MRTRAGQYPRENEGEGEREGWGGDGVGCGVVGEKGGMGGKRPVNNAEYSVAGASTSGC